MALPALSYASRWTCASAMPRVGSNGTGSLQRRHGCCASPTHSPSHSISGATQPSVHSPRSHRSPSAHTAPRCAPTQSAEAPQCSASLDGSTQRPRQSISPGAQCSGRGGATGHGATAAPRCCPPAIAASGCPSGNDAGAGTEPSPLQPAIRPSRQSPIRKRSALTLLARAQRKPTDRDASFGDSKSRWVERSATCPISPRSTVNEPPRCTRYG